MQTSRDLGTALQSSARKTPTRRCAPVAAPAHRWPYRRHFPSPRRPDRSGLDGPIDAVPGPFFRMADLSVLKIGLGTNVAYTGRALPVWATAAAPVWRFLNAGRRQAGNPPPYRLQSVISLHVCDGAGRGTQASACPPFSKAATGRRLQPGGKWHAELTALQSARRASEYRWHIPRVA